MKMGCNAKNKATAIKMALNGDTAKDISEAIGVHISGVKEVMPSAADIKAHKEEVIKEKEADVSNAENGVKEAEESLKIAKSALAALKAVTSK